MPVEISVILPSRNKFPQNLLTLFALENQTISPDRYEVVLIDDASSDATATIPEQWNFPYHLRYIRLPHNTGRPAARNTGICHSAGDLIIFLDAEILVEPGFLESHLELHRQNPRLLASGVLTMKGGYTQIEHGLSHEQRYQLYQLLRHNQQLLPLWDRHIQTGEEILLFDRTGIHNGEFRSMALDKSFVHHYENEILSRHGDQLNGFHFPWLISHTGNLSVRRSAFEQYGLFEEYEGYGWDDLELGYRLFLKGYSFAHIRFPYTYHQEHPVSPSVNDEAEGNFYIFQQKYREISLLTLLLSYTPQPFAIFETNLALGEIYRLSASSSGIYAPLLSVLRTMLEAVGYLRRFKLPLQGLLVHSGCPEGSEERSQFMSQYFSLCADGGYPYLCEAVRRLISF